MRSSMHVYTVEASPDGTRKMLKRPLYEGCEVKKLPGSLSFSRLAALQEETDGDPRNGRKQLRRDMLAAVSDMTACGKVLDSMKILLEKEDGDNGPQVLEWNHARPAALLHKICAIKKQVGDLLPNNSPCHLVFYLDECQPGNVLRPDKAREVACFYWTIKEKPSWFRSRNAGGWFFFGAFPTKWIHRVPGGFSYLFGRMLETFFEEQHGYLNFATGFPVSRSRGMAICKARMGFVVADAKALKQLWLLSGENGTKPCFQCRNVVGRMPRENLEGHRYLVHFTSSDKSRFQPHTTVTARCMVDKLASVAGNKKECKRLGQLYGLMYHPQGVLWHPRLGKSLSHVDHSAFDWMHIIVTSGAVGQYEVNSFCKELVAQGIS